MGVAIRVVYELLSDREGVAIGIWLFRMANRYLDSDLPDAPMVFLEFHATHGIETEIDLCRMIFEGHDICQFEMSADETAMADLWEARRELAYAMRNYEPELRPFHPGAVRC